MSRALAVGLVGTWLGLLVASWIVATVNFRTVDRVLGTQMRPEVGERLTGVSPADRRVVMRHLVSEVNRRIFTTWGSLQLVLGALALLLLWSGGGAPRLLLGLSLVLLVAQAGLLTPPIVEFGRSLDFVPRPLPGDVARRFGLLHAAYVGSDFVKAALLVATAWLGARRG